MKIEVWQTPQGEAIMDAAKTRSVFENKFNGPARSTKFRGGIYCTSRDDGSCHCRYWRASIPQTGILDRPYERTYELCIAQSCQPRARGAASTKIPAVNLIGNPRRGATESCAEFENHDSVLRSLHLVHRASLSFARLLIIFHACKLRSSP